MTSGASAENGRLFDWKKGGRYSWKASYALSPADRLTREVSPASQAGGTTAAPATVQEPSSKLL
jgi:hypothetical protein